jgi:endonuclease/exonuclease/phosphatase family metal-dependent hydrolase
MRYLIALVTIALPALPAAADQAPISIDGVFTDWTDIAPVLTDPVGDASGAVDFTSLSLADDDLFFFLRFETIADFDLSENNDLVLFLDTDANPDTGLAIGGIGAELAWHPGDGEGVFYPDGSASVAVYQGDIRFRGGPTVDSNVFEIALGRDTTPDDTHPLFTGPQVGVLLVDGMTGDTIPDAGGTLTYTLDVGSAPPTTPRSIARTHPDHLRLLTHNVRTDRLFNGGQQARFQRLYTAVAPDILHLQEIYDHSPEQTRNLVAPWLGGTWHAAGVHDCHTISRFPILGSWAIDLNLAVLIDTSSVIGTEILCINAHLPCCTNDSGRQWESDAITAFIREAYLPGGVLSLDADVPVLIAGDLNMVGSPRQLETLITGDILDNASHGPDAAPDPDGTDLTSVLPRLTEKRMGYTWRSDTSWYWPGHLDFFIYSDSNLRHRHDYTICTLEMSGAALAKNGLYTNDSACSDHLVFCVDFAPSCHADIDHDDVVDVTDLLILIGAWGECENCPADVTGDGLVSTDDLLIVLGDWGNCP